MVDVVGLLCVVSPHLDDGVLSCGHLLARHPGAVVLTVFASAPDGPAGPWNAETTGLADAGQALAARRAEDVAAVEALGATARWLDLHEHDYDGRDPAERRDEVAAAVRHALVDLAPGTVVAPLGFMHVDHRLTAEAALAAVASVPARWYLYEDQPYAQSIGVAPRLRRRVLRVPDYRREALRLARRRVEVGRPEAVTGDPDRKVAAVDRYATQLTGLRRSFPRYEERVRGPERYWPVTAVRGGAGGSSEVRPGSAAR